MSISSCTNKAEIGTSAPLKKQVISSSHIQSQRPLSEKIDPDAVSPITKEEFPKLYSVFGKKGLNRINRLMPLVARKAAESPLCDKVVYVGVSDRSFGAGEIIFFVDCQNHERFYISERDLSVNAAAVSQSERAAEMSDASAISLAESAVKIKLQSPLSFEKKFATTSVLRHNTTGSISVDFDFTSQNGLGLRVPGHARCIISSDRNVDVTITE
jgi:hypothetical protein